MSLKERLAGLRRRLSEPRAASAQTSAARARAGKAAQGFARVATELLKLGREMLVIPVGLWLAIAELAGIVVLEAWRRFLRPLIVAVVRVARALYRLALRYVTPARAVAAVCLATLVALALSQWLDYRGISVGAPSYQGEIGLVAPAPEIARERAGEAHAWLPVPLALGGALALGLALAGRRRAALAQVAVGVAAIVIALAIDAPKGLDEGSAALAYEGAEAHLLAGFWLQTATGAVLIACGLLLFRYLGPATAAAPAPTTRSRRRPLASVLGGAQARLKRT